MNDASRGQATKRHAGQAAPGMRGSLLLAGLIGEVVQMPFFNRARRPERK